MSRFAQLPDLNPIEHLWRDVEKYVAEKIPLNVNYLWSSIPEGWQQIPLTRCQDLFDTILRRFEAVIKNVGYCTKYLSKNNFFLYYRKPFEVLSTNI